MTTECVLATAKQLRLVITALCFGGVLLWIISGQYLDRDEALGYVGAAEDGPAELGWRAREWSGRAQLPRSHLRKLLEATAGEGLGWSPRHFHNGSELDGAGDPGYNTATAQCSDVHKLSRNESKCTYVETVNSCQNDDGLLNYLDFIYCTVPGKLIPLALVLLFFWLLFLFIFLGATAEEYFCPSLTVMSQVLHLSQNVAGVTLLALGNGAPDIFSAFAAISQQDDHKSSLAIGALFGAGIFVTTIVVGAVALLTPFQLTKRPFLRDIIFYTVAVYWTFYLLWRNTVDIYNAAGFIALYVVYVLVVIIGRAVYQKWKNKKRDGQPHPQSDIARKPVSPTGEELSSSGPVLNGTVPAVMNGTLPTATSEHATKTRVSGSHFSGSIPPIPEEEDEEEEEEQAGGWLHHVVHLSNEVPESDTQTYPGGTIQITTPEESEQSPALPGRSRLHTPPVHPPPPPPPPPAQQLANREELFAGGSAHPLFPQIGAALLSPGVASRKGRSVSPPPNMERAWGYSQRRVLWDDLERPRSASPRKLLRKTLLGALDITEEVGVAVGIPHVPQIWEEVHRVHHLHKSKSPALDRSHESEREEAGEGEEKKEEEEEEEEEEDETTPFIPKRTKRPHPILVLMRALWPFGEDFKQLGLTGKIYEIVKYPCSLILTLTVPVIDHDADLHNWNRWLNILHCVTGPMVVAVFTKRGLYIISGVFPVWTLVLVLSVLVAIVVACTSRNDKPPVYHCAFAWVGFVVSVVWIYCIANEIVNLLQAFGIVIKLSDGILGLTLLAWGNSIGDAVSNLTMARQGFPRMALGACFGGPLLNMLIGIGVASVYKSIKRRADGFKFKLYFTQVEFFAAAFLIVSLALSLAVITFLRFRLRRPYGIFLIVFYIAFLIVAIIAETQVFTITISGVLSKQQ